MPRFDVSHVSYGKSEQNNQIVIRGEITNLSGRNYTAVAVRVVLFIKNFPIANIVIVVNGLPNDSTRVFEKYVEELEYEKVGKDITRFEAYVESAY